MNFSTLPFSAEAWFRIPVYGKIYHNIMGNRVGAELWWRIIIRPDTPDIYVELGAGGGSSSFTLSTENLSDDRWHHIAFVRNSTNHGMVYIDGMLRGSAGGMSTNVNNSGNFEIGSGQGGNDPFNGTVDEVALWNRALTGDEIRAHYLGGLSLFRSGSSLVFSAGNATLSASIASWSNSTWYHVAGTYDGTNAFLYDSGILKATAAFGATSYIGNETYLGSDWMNLSTNYTNGTVSLFNGTMDNIKVWSASLTGAQVNGSSINAIDATNLAGWWKLDDASGVLSCPSDFSKVVVATNCAGVGAEFTRTPRC